MSLRSYSAITSNVSPYGVIPYQISPLSTGITDSTLQGVTLQTVIAQAADVPGDTAGNAAKAAAYVSYSAAATLTASLGIGKSVFPLTTASSTHSKTQCMFYTSLYKLAPLEEERFFGSYAKRTILFDDHIVFCNDNRFLNIASGGQVSVQLTAGQTRLRSLIIMPYLSGTSHGSPITALGTTYTAGVGQLGSPMQSPFSSCPGTLASYGRINNLNVLLSGSNYYQTALQYGYEQYFNEVRLSKSAYGGKMREISSGLLSQNDWETLYPFVYVDLANHTYSEANDNTPRSVNVSFTNASTVAIDYWIFLVYQRELSISANGSLVI